MIWRVLTSKHIHTSVTELDERWSHDDLLEAHEVLDALEAAEAEAANG